MPPLGLMILDSLADDTETVYTMRDCGEMKPSGLALVGETALLGALRSLITDGLIAVESEYVVIGEETVHREVSGTPATSDDDLRRYWFVMTRDGWHTFEAASNVLDAYWDTHPLERVP